MLNLASQDIIKALIKSEIDYTQDIEAIEAIETEEDTMDLSLYNNQSKFFNY